MIFILSALLFVLFIIFYFLCGPVIFMIVSICQGSFVKSHKLWSNFGCKLLRVKFVKLPESKQVNKNSKTMLLLNHRSWSDFFIHDIITEYTANYVSRLAVGLIFPSILLLSQLSRSIWFFQRGKKGSLDQLFDWFSNKWENAYRKNVIIYPEGHRMYNAIKPSYLKKGMIGYAYKNNIDCQIIITFGNDLVCDEKKLKLRSGQTVYSWAGEVISPKNFKNEEEFYKHICEQFNNGFEMTKKYLIQNKIDLSNKEDQLLMEKMK